MVVSKRDQAMFQAKHKSTLGQATQQMWTGFKKRMTLGRGRAAGPWQCKQRGQPVTGGEHLARSPPTGVVSGRSAGLRLKRGG